MQKPKLIRRGRKPREGCPSEEGYMLLAVICMLALLTISLAVAVPDITKSIQRDQEIETMHRGMQYRRAIQLYYRKFASYPPSIDALVKTNNIRFLRKRYLDPMTRKDDWKPIYLGQNKTPLAMGFFGQPLGGLSGATPIAGTGPSGGNGLPGAGLASGGPGFGGMPGAASSGPGFGSSDNGSSATGAPANGDTSGTSSDGSGGSTATGSSPGTGSSTGTGFMSGQNGQTFGGAGIVGFEPGGSKQSILLYKKKDHYNQWEFTYSPMSDMQQQAGNGGLNAGSSGTGTGTGSNGTSNTFGGSSNTFGGGSSNTFGGSSGGTFGGSSSPSPTQPQQ